MRTPKQGDRVRLVGCNHIRSDQNHDLMANAHGKEGIVVHRDSDSHRPFITVETDDHERWGCYFSGTEMIVLEKEKP